MEFSHLIEQQDIVLKVSFGILVLMSLLSWSVILIRSVFVMRQKSLAKATQNSFFDTPDFASLNTSLKGQGGVFYFMVKESVQAVDDYYHHEMNLGLSKTLGYRDFLELSIKNTMQKQLRRFDGGLTMLASIGAVAPFIGLFGTVWGIFNALMDISTQGQVSIATISAPIGEALVATAAGLFVAIPAVLGYNAISRINRNFRADTDHFAHILFIHLLKMEGK
ncbi:Biopolymer transport protein exbB [Phocoenobacter uteri]|uniref:Biopolymer transport protein ExbB n=1 Tax=Phocoenobacter uteri TaxID=146806 RepID=A0A379CCA0_9PAST|nr:MotA/TolQ/ExbB proton channel family protein [Phocoenobacter uteri]MDG6881905.1 hypothetical protein [Phocoenobacter uteri]SUB59943.1 Biopolymer transport protein exbB [Phocoenobacter uteri]